MAKLFSVLCLMVSTATAHKFHGCFVLPLGCSVPTASIAGCAYMCRARGTYFGLQTDQAGSRYCWCGSKGPDLNPAELDLSKCNTPCSVGSDTEKCGAPFSAEASYSTVYSCDSCRASDSITALESCNGGSDSSTASSSAECQVGAWDEWGVCSATCDGGLQNRTRTVSGTCASQSNLEHRACNTGACPVDCQESFTEGECQPDEPCAPEGVALGVVSGQKSFTSTSVTAASSTGRACVGDHTRRCSFRCPDAAPPKCADAGSWADWDRSCAAAVGSINPHSFTEPQYTVGDTTSFLSSAEWNPDELCDLLIAQSVETVPGALANLGSTISSQMAGVITSRSVEMQHVVIPSTQGAALKQFSNPSSQLTSYVSSIYCFPQCHDPATTGHTNPVAGSLTRQFEWNVEAAAGRYAVSRFGSAAATSSYLVDGEQCPPEERSKSCSLPACRTTPVNATGVDCTLSPWVDWSQCPECGDADVMHTRSRSVLAPAEHNGQACAELTQSVSCGLSPCAVDCVVDSWSQFGACNSTCNGGFRSRQRAIVKEAAFGGLSCGFGTEEQECNMAPCPEDCVLGSDWSDWNECSSTCNGRQLRSRPVISQGKHGGKPCDTHKEERLCNVDEACDQDCELSAWSEWAGCAPACGEGAYRSRSRSVVKSRFGRGAACGAIEGVEQCGACADELAPRLLSLQPEHESEEVPLDMEYVFLMFATDSVPQPEAAIERLQSGSGELKLWTKHTNTLAASVSVSSSDVTINNRVSGIVVRAKLDVLLTPNTTYYVTLPAGALWDQPGSDSRNTFGGISAHLNSSSTGSAEWMFTTEETAGATAVSTLLELGQAMEARLQCRWIGKSAGNDNWCNNNCNHVTPFCPKNFCRCNSNPPPPPPPAPFVIKASNPAHLSQNVARSIKQLMVTFSQQIVIDTPGKRMSLRSIGAANPTIEWLETEREIFSTLTGIKTKIATRIDTLSIQIPEDNLPLPENTLFCLELQAGTVKNKKLTQTWEDASSIPLYGRSVGCSGISFSTGSHAPYITRTLPVHRNRKVSITRQHVDFWVDHAVELHRCTKDNDKQPNRKTKSCKWIGKSAGNDYWCNSNCNHVTPFCPAGFCRCGTAAPHKHVAITLHRTQHLAFTKDVTIAKFNSESTILVDDTPTGEQKIRLVLPEGALDTGEEGEARFRVEIPQDCFREYQTPATPITAAASTLLLELSAARKSCKWIGKSAGNDNWCNNNCNHVTPFCPKNFCRCNSVATPPPPPAPAPAQGTATYSWTFGTVNGAPPVITQTVPAHNAVDVSTRLGSLAMRFNEFVNAATDGIRSIEVFELDDCPKGFSGERYDACKPVLTQLVHPDDSQSLNHRWGAGNTLLTVAIDSITSVKLLKEDTTYFVVLQEGLVFDRANPPNPFAGWQTADYWRFTTAFAKAPSPIWTYPANGQKDVSPHITMLRVQYDMSIQKSLSNGRIKLASLDRAIPDVLVAGMPLLKGEPDPVWTTISINALDSDSPLPPLRNPPSKNRTADCKGTWSVWAGCVDECDESASEGSRGTMTRYFTITREAGDGGEACPDPPLETASCPVQPCSRECAMSSWSEWAVCPMDVFQRLTLKSCPVAEATHQRTRTIETEARGNGRCEYTTLEAWVGGAVKGYYATDEGVTLGPAARRLSQIDDSWDEDDLAEHQVLGDEYLSDFDDELVDVEVGRKSCTWIGASAGSNSWCNNNCNHVPAFCPRNFCRCSNTPPPPPGATGTPTNTPTVEPTEAPTLAYAGMLNVPTPRDLLPSTTYCMDVVGGAILAAGPDGKDAANAAYCFQTADTKPPNYMYLAPRHGATGVSIKLPQLKIKFDEPIRLNQLLGADISLVPTNTSERTVTIRAVPWFEGATGVTVAANGMSAVLHTNALLAGNTKYHVVVPEGVFTDRATVPNNYTGCFVDEISKVQTAVGCLYPFGMFEDHHRWSFTTGSMYAPRVCDFKLNLRPGETTNELGQYLVPFNGETLVPISTFFSVTFCDPIVLGTTGTIVVWSPVNASASSFAWDLASKLDRLRLSVVNASVVVNGTIVRVDRGVTNERTTTDADTVYSSDTLRMDLPAGEFLTADADYSVEVPEGAVLDAVSSTLEAGPLVIWDFATAPALDPPLLLQGFPIGTNVMNNATTLVLVFDQEVWLGSHGMISLNPKNWGEHQKALERGLPNGQVNSYYEELKATGTVNQSNVVIQKEDGRIHRIRNSTADKGLLKLAKQLRKQKLRDEKKRLRTLVKESREKKREKKEKKRLRTLVKESREKKREKQRLRDEKKRLREGTGTLVLLQQDPSGSSVEPSVEDPYAQHQTGDDNSAPIGSASNPWQHWNLEDPRDVSRISFSSTNVEHDTLHLELPIYEEAVYAQGVSYGVSMSSGAVEARGEKREIALSAAVSPGAYSFTAAQEDTSGGGGGGGICIWCIVAGIGGFLLLALLIAAIAFKVRKKVYPPKPEYTIILDDPENEFNINGFGDQKVFLAPPVAFAEAADYVATSSRSSRPSLRNLDHILTATEDLLTGGMAYDDFHVYDLLDDVDSETTPFEIQDKRIRLAEILVGIEQALVPHHFGDSGKDGGKDRDFDAFKLQNTPHEDGDGVDTAQPGYGDSHIVDVSEQPAVVPQTVTGGERPDGHELPHFIEELVKLVPQLVDHFPDMSVLDDLLDAVGGYSETPGHAGSSNERPGEQPDFDAFPVQNTPHEDVLDGLKNPAHIDDIRYAINDVWPLVELLKLDEQALLTSAKILDAVAQLESGILSPASVQSLLYDASVIARVLPQTEVELMSKEKASNVLHSMSDNTINHNFEDPIAHQPDCLRSWPVITDCTSDGPAVLLEPLHSPEDSAPVITNVNVEFDPVRDVPSWEPATAAQTVLENTSIGVARPRVKEHFDVLQALVEIADGVLADESQKQFDAFSVQNRPHYAVVAVQLMADGVDSSNVLRLLDYLQQVDKVTPSDEGLRERLIALKPLVDVLQADSSLQLRLMDASVKVKQLVDSGIKGSKLAAAFQQLGETEEKVVGTAIAHIAKLKYQTPDSQISDPGLVNSTPADLKTQLEFLEHCLEVLDDVVLPKLPHTEPLPLEQAFVQIKRKAESVPRFDLSMEEMSVVGTALMAVEGRLIGTWEPDEALFAIEAAGPIADGAMSKCKHLLDFAIPWLDTEVAEDMDADSAVFSGIWEAWPELFDLTVEGRAVTGSGRIQDALKALEAEDMSQLQAAANGSNTRIMHRALADDRQLMDSFDKLLQALNDFAPNHVEGVRALLPQVELWQKEVKALDDILDATSKWFGLAALEDSVALEQLADVAKELHDAVIAHAPLLVELMAVQEVISLVLVDSLVVCQRAADAADAALIHGRVKRMVAAIDQRIAANMLQAIARPRRRALKVVPLLLLDSPDAVDEMPAVAKQLKKAIGQLAQEKAMEQFLPAAPHLPSEDYSCPVLKQLSNLVIVLEEGGPAMLDNTAALRDQLMQSKQVVDKNGVPINLVEGASAVLGSMLDAVFDGEVEDSSGLQLQCAALADRVAKRGQNSKALLRAADTFHNAELIVAQSSINSAAKLECAVQSAWPTVGRLQLECAATMQLTELLTELEAVAAGEMSKQQLNAHLAKAALCCTSLQREEREMIASETALSGLMELQQPAASEVKSEESLQSVESAMQNLIQSADESTQHGEALTEVLRELSLMSHGFKSISDGKDFNQWKQLWQTGMDKLTKDCSVVAIKLRASGSNQGAILENVIVCVHRLFNNQIKEEELASVIQNSQPLVRQLKSKAAMASRLRTAVEAAPSGVLAALPVGKPRAELIQEWVGDSSAEKQLTSDSETELSEGVHLMMGGTEDSVFSAIGNYYRAASSTWDTVGVISQGLVEPGCDCDLQMELQQTVYLVSKLAQREYTTDQVRSEWPGARALNVTQQQLSQLQQLLPAGAQLDEAAWQRMWTQGSGHELAAEICKGENLSVLEAMIEEGIEGPSLWAWAKMSWTDVVMLMANTSAAKYIEQMKQAVDAYAARNMSRDEMWMHAARMGRKSLKLGQISRDIKTAKLLAEDIHTLSPNTAVDMTKQQITAAVRRFNAQSVQFDMLSHATQALQALGLHLAAFMQLPEAIQDLRSSTVGYDDLKAAVQKYASVPMKLRAAHNEDLASCIENALINAQRVVDHSYVDETHLRRVVDSVGQHLVNCQQHPRVDKMRYFATAALNGDTARLKRMREPFLREESNVYDVLCHKYQLLAASLSGHNDRPQQLLSHYAAQSSERDLCLVAFNALDKNRDGQVSTDEVVNYLFTVPRSQWPKGLQDLNPFMRKALTARMGGPNWSKTEFKAWWSQHENNNVCNTTKPLL